MIIHDNIQKIKEYIKLFYTTTFIIDVLMY